MKERDTQKGEEKIDRRVYLKKKKFVPKIIAKTMCVCMYVYLCFFFKCLPLHVLLFSSHSISSVFSVTLAYPFTFTHELAIQFLE